MAEPIGRTALIVTADMSGLTSGLRKGQQDHANFVTGIQRQSATFTVVKPEQVRATFTPIQSEINDIGSSIQRLVGGLRGGGGLGGIVGALPFAQLTPAIGGVTAAASSLLTTVLPLGAAFGAATFGVVRFAAAVRGASREAAELSRFARFIGTDVAGAQTLLRVFENAGLESELAGRALNRFRSILGQIREDPEGGLAQSIARIGVSVENLGDDPVTALRRVLEATERMSNSFDRGRIQAQLFGEEAGVRLQDVMIDVGRAFDRAGGQVRQFGLSAGEAEAAERTERRWREVGTQLSGVWEQVRREGRSAFLEIGEAASIALQEALKLDEELFGPRADRIRGINEGIFGPQGRARREQADAEARAKENFAAPAADRKPLERFLEGAREAREALERGLGALREMSEAGLAAAAPTRSLAEDWTRTAQTIGQSAAEVRQFEIASADARAREAEQRFGIFGAWARQAADELRHADAMLSAAERLNRLREEGNRLAESTRTPLERFRAEANAIGRNTTQSEAVRARGIAEQFRQLTAGLGSGPASFGLTGTSSRSLEGVLAADDRRIRDELERQRQTPEWVRSVLAQLEQAEQAAERRNQDLVRAIQEAGIGRFDGR